MTTVRKHAPKKSDGAELAPAQAIELANAVEYAAGSVVSRTIAKSAGGSLTLFAFDQGQALSEHSAPFDAYVTVLDGTTTLTIGGKKVVAKAGETVRMPAHVPHAVQATARFKMLLAMLRG